MSDDDEECDGHRDDYGDDNPEPLGCCQRVSPHEKNRKIPCKLLPQPFQNDIAQQFAAIVVAAARHASAL